MKMACIDLEGVLIPELWPQIAQASGIEALSITTREEPDYPALMRWRLDHLRKNGLRLRDVQSMIAKTQTYPDAVAFLQQLTQQQGYRIHIVSDCFYELAGTLLDALGSPESFCHSLETDADGWITGCAWADRNGKRNTSPAYWNRVATFWPRVTPSTILPCCAWRTTAFWFAHRRRQ
ncbi:bifunctional phosphoserine phosphatase/homoserine phosphotransferase ThrH [Musicola paradisiaca]|uniref:Phosphoserine phosphatase n=1 Tax=Musicola paradisiaca (strain Ech703) TaxID=579405 RepID=C6CD17_MUSP7|nr:bifunctional phosphoserine phosphatase/homoserine phosphotransferase ThrH [Musicola paradisiaca]ACS85058.1 hypothetical protein Dd703_1255 [Musicola paradisiaca Ech703]